MTNSIKLSESEEIAFSEATCEALKREIMVPREAPLYERMSLALEKLIQTGVLRPGQQLPSERDMTRQLGLSRRTVRAALGNLIERKKLVPVHGKGNFIRKENRALAEVLVPEPFLPDHWGNRPDHYHWIRRAAKKARCAERYVFAPDLDSLDRLLQLQPDRQEGVLVFRPNQEWLNHLEAFRRDAKTIRLRPIMVVNREIECPWLNFVADDHREAVIRSVGELIRRTEGPLGLVTVPFKEYGFSGDQKAGFEAILTALGRRKQAANHLELPVAALRGPDAGETILNFIRSRNLSGLIVAGSAYERTVLEALSRLDAKRLGGLHTVVYSERRENPARPANCVAYLEPTEKILDESLDVLREILDGTLEQPVHRRILGDFLQPPPR